MNRPEPLTEADLHAWVDGQLSAERAREIDAYLSTRPEEAERLDAYRAQKRELHALFDPVLDEPVPGPVFAAARRPARAPQRAIAAAVIAGLLGGAGGWTLRGSLAPTAAQAVAANEVAFAQRAAVAHAVYSPDARRPVEVSAAQEDQLVTWLSRRMGTPMKPPHLQELGYALEGGRLLPGGRGPVAQFMYRDASGAKLTLYVSNDVTLDTRAGSTAPAEPAFRFAQESGGVNVFYWVEGRFGYALSASLPRGELARVADVVYRDWRAGR